MEQTSVEVKLPVTIDGSPNIGLSKSAFPVIEVFEHAFDIGFFVDREFR
jgi:hypothetical protein